MAAREHQREALVGHGVLLLGQLGHALLELAGELGLLGAQHRLAAQAVDRPALRGREDPRARLVGGPVLRPAIERDDVGVLDGLLGPVEVAEVADQAGEDAAPLVAEDLLEQRYLSSTGRTSTAPP